MENQNVLHIYLAPDGCDCAEGTREKPLATIKGARDFLRRTPHPGGAIVTLTAGTYPMSEKIVLEAQDGGSEGAPVVYEGEGEVILTGGVTLPHSAIRPVTDPAMLSRLPAPALTRVLDLSEYGIDDTIGEIVGQPRFFMGDDYTETARYPKNERLPGRFGPYLPSSHVITEYDNGHHLTIFYEGDEIKEKLKKWEKSLPEIYIYGYFTVQWSLNRYRVTGADPEQGIVYADVAMAGYEHKGDNVNPQRRSYLSNMIEELSVPGEYVYDRASRQLYFIPSENFDENTPLSLSLMDDNLFDLESISHIAFRNLKFRYFRRNLFVGKSVCGLTIEKCEFAYLSERISNVINAQDCRIDSCDVYNTGCGGFDFNQCGDRPTLRSANMRITNCIFRDFNRMNTCYRPAIEVYSSCGLLFSHNSYFDTPHNVILLGHCNDVIIEESDFHNVCRDTDDASAIYWGRDPSTVGIVIRNNYFETCGNDEAPYACSLLYVDDWAVSPELYNNVFYDCSHHTRKEMSIHTNANGIMLNCGQFLNAHNNIFISAYPDEKPCNLYPSDSLSSWMSYVNGADEKEDSEPTDGYKSWYYLLERNGFFTDTYREHYKNTVWAGLWDIVNEERHQQVLDYFEAHKDDRQQAQIDLVWMFYDYAWDHVTEDGKPYNGTLREYLEETLTAADDPLKDNLNVQLLNRPGAWSYIFNKIVFYKLKFRTTNVFENNLCIGMDRSYLDENELLKGNVMNGFQNNYNPMTDKLADGSSMFVDYAGRNFKLTEKGMHEVCEHIPAFHNIDVSKVGAKR